MNISNQYSERMPPLQTNSGGFRALATLVATALLLGMPGRACAEPIFFGPTPYLSSADSPFDLSGLGTTMFLEDFEDGELNATGVVFGGAKVMQPSPTIMNTDSVDADDGAIDGFGREGHSVTNTGAICSGHSCISSMAFLFDATALGRLPTAAGIVWTDGLPSDRVQFSLLDEDLNEIASIGVDSLGDLDRLGGTAEDRFFGVIESEGIYGILLSAWPVGGNIEADHLQYGFFVPEPSTALLAAFGVGLLATIRGKRS